MAEEKKKAVEEEVYKLIMAYIEKRYPQLKGDESEKKYDFYLRLLSKLQTKYIDYLRGYFINYLRKAEDFDVKNEEKLIEELEKEIDAMPDEEKPKL